MNPRRRAALAAIAASAFSPLLGPAADERVRTVGYLSNGATPEFMAKRLAELGWIEGRNLRFEVRSLEGKLEAARVKAAAEQLVRLQPEVIFTFGTMQVKALAAETRTIPIVCGGTPDPVGSGLTKSIHRSGTNVTGISFGIPEQSQIQVGLMRALLPGLRRIVMIMHAERAEPFFVPLRSLVDAATAGGIEWTWAPSRTLDEALAALARIRDTRREIAYLMTQGTDDEFPEKPLAETTLRLRIATTCTSDSLVRAGGLMTYGVDHADPMGRVAALIDKLLRGANPAETPFELPDRTTFILNRATAKAIGVAIPPEILLRATEVIG